MKKILFALTTVMSAAVAADHFQLYLQQQRHQLELKLELIDAAGDFPKEIEPDMFEKMMTDKVKKITIGDRDYNVEYASRGFDPNWKGISPYFFVRSGFLAQFRISWSENGEKFFDEPFKLILSD